MKEKTFKTGLENYKKYEKNAKKITANSTTVDAVLGEAVPKALRLSNTIEPIGKKSNKVEIAECSVPKKLHLGANEDSLFGRLGLRMSSRDFIDNLDLGTLKNEMSENGFGRHIQNKQFTSPIPKTKPNPGMNMGEQARKLGNVFGKDVN